MIEYNVDLYLLGSLSFAAILSLVSSKVTVALIKQQSELTYINFNISPKDLRDSAAEAVRENCHTLVMPIIYASNNDNKLFQVQFTDQRLKLDYNYQYLDTNQLENEDDL